MTLTDDVDPAEQPETPAGRRIARLHALAARLEGALAVRDAALEAALAARDAEAARRREAAAALDAAIDDLKSMARD